MTEIVIYIGLEVLIAVIALIDNSLVVTSLWRFKSLRTPTNWFVLSLALADIAVAIFAIPSAILLRVGLLISPPADHSSNITSTVSTVLDASSSLIDLREGTASVQLGACLLIICSVISLTQVSIFGLLLIAIDRFIAINYPLQYHNRLTSRRVKWSIAATWVLGVLIGLIPEFGWNKYNTETISPDRHGHAHCRFEEVISMEYMVFFNFFVCVLLPLVVMLFLYLLIFRSAKHQLLKIYSDVALKQKVKWSEHKTPPSNTSKVPKHPKSAASYKSHCGNHGSIDHPQILYTRALSLTEHSTHNGNKSITSDSGNFTNGMTQNSLPTKKYNRKSCKSDKLRRVSTTTDAHLCEFPKIEQHKCKERSSSLSHIEDDLRFFSVRTPQPHVFSRDKSFSLKLSWKNRKNEIERSGKTNKNHNNIFFNTRPRGKAFSFTTTTPKLNSDIDKNLITKKRPTIKRYNPDTRKMSDKPETRTHRRESCSSLYMSQYGVWSAIEKPKLTPRMRRRKTEFLKKEFRAARSLATVVGVFAICWLPLHILNCITYFCPGCYQPNLLTDIAIILSHANSTVNPLIYAFKLRDFRSAFRNIMKDLLRKTSLRKKKIRKRSAMVLSGFTTTSAASPAKSNQVSPFDKTIINTTDTSQYSDNNSSENRAGKYSINNSCNNSISDVFCSVKENNLPIINENSSGVDIRRSSSSTNNPVSCSRLSGLEIFLTQETVV